MRALEDPPLIRAVSLLAVGLLFQFAEPLSLSGQSSETNDVRARTEAPVRAPAPAGGTASARVLARVLPVPGVAQEARALEHLLLRLREEGRGDRPGTGPDLRIREGGVVGEARRTPSGARITLAHLGN